MAADIPEIRELDINPLLADEAGVLAVDARVAVGRVGRANSAGSGPTNFAVRPYPSQWQRHIEVKDGWRVFVRPIRPEDEPLIHELLRHVTPAGSAAAVLRADEGIHPRVHRPPDRSSTMPARWPSSRSTKPATNWSAWSGSIPISIYESGEYAILLQLRSQGQGARLGA